VLESLLLILEIYRNVSKKCVRKLRNMSLFTMFHQKNAKTISVFKTSSNQDKR
jgi:hypothetical protein